MEYIFSKKQAGVIFKAWKQGKIEADKQVISRMYDLAENGIDGWTNAGFSMNYAIIDAVSLIFEGRYEEAQKKMDLFTYRLGTYEGLQRMEARSRARAVAC